MNFSSLHLFLAETELVHPGSSGLDIHAILHSNVLNFFLVLIFLVWIIRKTNIFSVIGEKQKVIKDNIFAAESNFDKSESALSEAKTLAISTEGEVTKIVNESRELAETLSSKIREEITVESEEIHKKASKTINTDTSKAKSDISKDVARAAFTVAEEHIKTVIDDNLHKKFINEFMDNLSNLKV